MTPLRTDLAIFAAVFAFVVAVGMLAPGRGWAW